MAFLALLFMCLHSFVLNALVLNPPFPFITTSAKTCNACMANSRQSSSLLTSENLTSSPQKPTPVPNKPHGGGDGTSWAWAIDFGRTGSCLEFHDETEVTTSQFVVDGSGQSFAFLLVGSQGLKSTDMTLLYPTAFNEFTTTGNLTEQISPYSTIPRPQASNGQFVNAAELCNNIVPHIQASIPSLSGINRQPVYAYTDISTAGRAHSLSLARNQPLSILGTNFTFVRQGMPLFNRVFVGASANAATPRHGKQLVVSKIFGQSDTSQNSATVLEAYLTPSTDLVGGSLMWMSVETNSQFACEKCSLEGVRLQYRLASRPVLVGFVSEVRDRSDSPPFLTQAQTNGYMVEAQTQLNSNMFRLGTIGVIVAGSVFGGLFLAALLHGGITRPKRFFEPAVNSFSRLE